MKRLLKTSLAVIVAALLAAVITTTVSFESAAALAAEPPMFSEQEMKNEISAFLGLSDEDSRKNRTPFSEGEKKAADYLEEQLNALSSFSTERQSFVYEPSSSSDGEKFYSQNIIASRKSDAERAKTVVIGADYDNSHDEISLTVTSGRMSTKQTLLEATNSEGAYSGATAVATLLSLARKIDALEGDLGFNLYIAFFGAGELWSLGAQKFVGEYISAGTLANTVLMVNLQRIGGDHLYAYSDEVRTDHGDYIFAKAREIGVALDEVPSTLPRMPATYIDGLPFAHLGMVGSSSAFASRGVPVVNMFGGTFDTFSYDLDESAGKKNIAETSDDTLKNLEENMPDYAGKMAQSAALLYGCLTSDDFISSVENSRETVQDYSFFMKGWIPALIAVGVLVICGLLIIPIARYFEKKYPPTPPKVRNLKVAVFGMDYENPSEGDVYIDVKRRDGGDDNPFKGY